MRWNMLKGQTTIELTDVNTKQTEVIQESNLVTNAVPDIFGYNPSGLLYPVSGSSTVFSTQFFPIANKCYGGILLFEDSLVEDATRYTPPANNTIVGYSSNNVNETDNPKRGSSNLTESSIIENGYKFVWDFSTSQANGVISSLALTHYTAGRSFYGDEYIADSSAILINRLSTTTNLSETAYYTTMVEADLANNTFVSIIPNTDKTLDITIVKEPMKTLSLNDTVISLTPQTLETKTLEIDSFYEGMPSTSQVSFFDGKDGYWYGFTRAVVTKETKTTLSRIRISKEDYSFTVNQWGLDGILINVLGTYSKSSSGDINRTNQSILYGEYLYVFSTGFTLVYKINIHNPVDVTKIELGFKSSYSTGEYNTSYLYQWGDRICGYDFNIDQEDRVTKTIGKGLPYISTPLIEFGPFRLGYSVYRDYRYTYFYRTLYLHSPYLGTINNLDTPILKTADKTMKIIYTLTEESEGSA